MKKVKIPISVITCILLYKSKAYSLNHMIAREVGKSKPIINR